jgi:spermidine synthase
LNLWYTEENQGSIRYGYKTKSVLFNQQSEFQSVEVIETEAFGKMMLLDGLVMITDVDEFVYHEMISHIPVCLHGGPKRVVVIGGGDGGTVRELLKYDGIEEIVLCEIDAMVIEAARKFFPEVSSGFDDPRVKIKVGDGVAYMKEHPAQELDLVIVDSTDPIGPGEGLFSREFYKNVARSLRPGGLMAAQSESPWYDKEVLQRIKNNVSAGFSTVKNYIGAVPTYPRGFWSWTIAGNRAIEPAQYSKELFNKVKSDLRYLNDDMMTGVFALPNFYREKL